MTREPVPKPAFRFCGGLNCKARSQYTDIIGQPINVMGILGKASLQFTKMMFLQALCSITKLQPTTVSKGISDITLSISGREWRRISSFPRWNFSYYILESLLPLAVSASILISYWYFE